MVNRSRLQKTFQVLNLYSSELISSQDAVRLIKETNGLESRSSREHYFNTQPQLKPFLNEWIQIEEAAENKDKLTIADITALHAAGLNAYDVIELTKIVIGRNRKLSTLFTVGDSKLGVSPDLWKARDWAVIEAKAQVIAAEEIQESKNAEDSPTLLEAISVHNKVTANSELTKAKKKQAEDAFFRTKTFYDMFSILNPLRLNMSMLDTLLDNYGRGFMSKVSPLFGPILSLVYFGRLLFDFGVVLKTTFYPVKSMDADNYPIPTRWERFKNALQKDNRPARILNDIVWGTMNLLGITFVAVAIGLNPVAVALITVAGLGIDMISSAWFSYKAYTETKDLLKKVDTLNFGPEKKDLLKTNLKKKLSDIKKSAKQNFVMGTAILVGLSLVMFSPVGATAAIFGAAITLAACVVWFGQSTMAWWKGRKKTDTKTILSPNSLVGSNRPSPTKKCSAGLTSENELKPLISTSKSVSNIIIQQQLATVHPDAKLESSPIHIAESSSQSNLPMSVDSSASALVEDNISLFRSNNNMTPPMPSACKDSVNDMSQGLNPTLSQVY